MRVTANGVLMQDHHALTIDELVHTYLSLNRDEDNFKHYLWINCIARDVAHAIELCKSVKQYVLIYEESKRMKGDWT